MARLIIVNSGTSVPSSGDPPCAVTLVNDGTDWGARINAADVSLGSAPGAICCYGGGNIASQIVLNAGGSSSRTLRFGPNATWTNGNTTGTTIFPHSNTVIEGHGWDTILQEPPGDDINSYFVVQPFGGSSVQVNNISVRNIQLSGVGVSKGPNATPSTVITGLLNGGTYENIWFNKTHGIGLCIGGINVGGVTGACKNLNIRGCKFTNVGGGIAPNYPGGGGVPFAIINGDRITIDGCTFIDALGNTIIDIEPNTNVDPVTNITLTNCLISQELTTGNGQKNVYGFVLHTSADNINPPPIHATPPLGPFYIGGNTFRQVYAGVPAGPGIGQYLYYGIFLGVDDVSVSTAMTIENNYIMGDFVLQNVHDNIVRNNTFIMPLRNMSVTGLRNTISGNTVESTAGQGAIGIVESGSGDFNTFSNNKVTAATVTVGTHSTVSGETVISPPSWPTAYPLLTAGDIMTTNANDLLIANIQCPSAESVSLPIPVIQSPFTVLQTTTLPSQTNIAPGYRTVTSLGTYRANWTLNQYLSQYNAVMLALKGSATLVQQQDAGQVAMQPPGLTPSASGGTLATGTYYYRVAGIYNGGEWLAPESSTAVTGPNGSVVVSWSAGYPGIAPYPSYKVYRGTAPGVYTTYFTTTSPFTDTGAAGTAGSPPAALVYTGTLGSTPTNGNGLILTYCFSEIGQTRRNIASISGGGVSWSKGPEAQTPWGIASIWYGLNVSAAPNGVITVTLDGISLAQQDRSWFNVQEWSGVTAVDGQISTTFPATW